MLDQLKKIYNSTLLFLNAIAVLLFVFAALSDRISPLTSVIPAFFGLVFPLFILMNVFFVLFWTIRLEWYGVVSFLTLLIFCTQIQKYSPLNLQSPPPPAKSVKILSYNVCYFSSSHLRPSNKTNPIITYINKVDADIVCLQEYSFTGPKGKLSEDSIRKALSRYPYYSFIEYVNDLNSGIVCFSKYPIEKATRIKLDSKYNAACIYRLNLKGRKITLINNHLESNKLSREDRKFYNYVLKNFQTDLIPEVKATLIHKLSEAYRIRTRQAEQIADIIKKQDNPVIVCGDFNDTPISYNYRTIRGNLQDAFVATGFGPGISYHENKFWFRIDHIFYSNKMKAYRAKIDRVKYSDHYPIYTYLSFED